MRNSFNRLLFTQVPGTTLALFRIFFGGIMIVEFYKFKMALVGFFQAGFFQFTYDYFHWIKPLPTDAFEVFFWLMMVNSALFALGVLYRTTSILQFLGFFYAFHLEASMYNNHFYLFVLVCFIMIFCRGDADYSAKSILSGNTTVPRWNILALQLQLFVVYFFGGVAKLNPEWLIHAQPVMSWLPNMLNNPLGITGLSESQLITSAFIFSYSGLLIDLLAGPLLFWRKTRVGMMIFLLGFHLMNSQMFKIGLFPWFGMGSLILFIDPHRIPALGDLKREAGVTKQLTLVKGLFITYFAVQCLIPLRHWVAPGWAMWNEKCFSFSWFMKLRTKLTIQSIKVKIDGDPQTYYVEPTEYVYVDQASLMAFTPYMLVQFSHKLEERLKSDMNIEADIKVYAEIYAKLHHHPYQLFVDPKQDLTQIPYEQVGLFDRMDWVYEFNPNAIEPEIDIMKTVNPSPPEN